MTYLNFISYILLTLLITPLAVNASPSETNYFYINLEGEDAESFRNTEPTQGDWFYGDNESHIAKNYYFFYTKDKDQETEFNLEITCQQRVLNYKTANAKALAPSCYFTYQNSVMYTNIIMTDEISAKMIKDMKWTPSKYRGEYYYGCYDNKEAGCPTIRYIPKTEKNEAKMDIRFFKP